MSLSTRIAIGPSRWLAFAEAAMIAGAIVVTAATVAARLTVESAPVSLWLLAGVAAFVAVAIGARRWIKQTHSCVYEVFIGERAGVSVRRLGEDSMPHPSTLTDAAMVWPGFAMLALALPTPLPHALAHGGGARHRVLNIPVVRAEMDANDAWRLHRFLLWAQRDGQHDAQHEAQHAMVSSGKDFSV